MNKNLNKYNLYLETASPYKRPAFVLLWVLLIMPVLFLLSQSFDVYLISHLLVIVTFPAFIWCYLESDKLSDFKLDFAKVAFIATGYSSYLLLLSFVMLKILKSKFVLSFLLIEFLYIGLLLIVAISIFVVLFLKHKSRDQYKDLAKRLGKKYKM